MQKIKYKNIDQEARMGFENAITKVAADSYHKGFNHGLTRGGVVAASILAEHRWTGESVAGFLAVCTCGIAYDSLEEHYTEVIIGRSSINQPEKEGN